MRVLPAKHSTPAPALRPTSTYPNRIEIAYSVADHGNQPRFLSILLQVSRAGWALVVKP
jgi:hypothetical protein